MHFIIRAIKTKYQHTVPPAARLMETEKLYNKLTASMMHSATL
jgi:hypothetical protein